MLKFIHDQYAKKYLGSKCGRKEKDVYLNYVGKIEKKRIRSINKKLGINK